MIIKVKFPFAERSTHSYYKVNDEYVKLGDIVMIRLKDGKSKYGVVNKVDVKNSPKLSYLKVDKVNELERVLFWVDFDNLILKNKVKLNKNSLEAYRKVKGNSKLSEEVLNNKITRNMLLTLRPKRIEISKSGNMVFRYGAMRITYGYGEVFNLINKSMNGSFNWKKDMDKYEYYSKILGVDKY